MVFFLLIRYVNLNNRSLERFLDVLNGNDRLANLNQRGKSFSNLNEAFNSVMDTLSQARIEKEEQFLFFRTAIEQVGVGLLAFDTNGKVLLLNGGAKKLLGISFLNRIEDLNRLHSEFGSILLHKEMVEDRIVPILVNGQLRKLSLRITEFRLRGNPTRMVSLQDIRSELEAGEVDAWQKLIRVITHEIMNSITPMKTLSTTLLKTFDREGVPCDLEELDEKKLKNTHLGLGAIRKRSEGLAEFVQSYRSITRIPQPVILSVRVVDLLSQVRLLVAEELKMSEVDLVVREIPADLQILVDEKLISQVLINLIRNAVSAVNGIKDPRIEVGVEWLKNGNVTLWVEDNGVGIDADTREQIFVPFFTTRKDGSGIGLSFSQQVMRLHKGKISVKSEPGNGARFELVF
jgi:nitrogen fixation/metabolism regulation signal transduction histidine kinase